MFAIAVGVAVTFTLVVEFVAPCLQRDTGPVVIATAAGVFS